MASSEPTSDDVSVISALGDVKTILQTIKDSLEKEKPLGLPEWKTTANMILAVRTCTNEKQWVDLETNEQDHLSSIHKLALGLHARLVNPKPGDRDAAEGHFDNLVNILNTFIPAPSPPSG